MGSGQWGRSQTDLGQTSKQLISTKQFVALSVHTNQQYIKYSKTNIQRNRIWVRIPRVTRNILGQTRLQLLISCSSVLFSQNLPKKKKKLRESSFFFFPPFFSHSFVLSPFFPESLFFCICINLPKTQYAEGIPLSFLLFPFLFENQNVSPFYVGSPLSICMQPY